MSNILEIYRRYLDLIEYLEEKFPGCVKVPTERHNPAIKMAPTVAYLLAIAPVTKVTTDQFIRASCDRFNALGTTQLEVHQCLDKVQIHTRNIRPLLCVLYHLMYRVGSAQMCIQGEYNELNALKMWLALFKAERVSQIDLHNIEHALRGYTRGRGYNTEGHALGEWINERVKYHRDLSRVPRPYPLS